MAEAPATLDQLIAEVKAAEQEWAARADALGKELEGARGALGAEALALEALGAQLRAGQARSRSRVSRPRRAWTTARGQERRRRISGAMRSTQAERTMGGSPCASAVSVLTPLVCMTCTAM